MFDEHFRPVQAIPLKGIPSRTRLSPDGRYGSATTFVSGHSYAVAASRPRRPCSIWLRYALGTLEEFAVWRDGAHPGTGLQFLGVTFTRDGDRFYATLATAGKTYLVAGSLAERAVRVIHDNVECPSLSPDETRVAFKRRIDSGGPIHWQPYVLDLASLAETPLAEARYDRRSGRVARRPPGALRPDRGQPQRDHPSLDVPADGSGQPNLFLERAASPAVVRWLGPNPVARPGSSGARPSLTDRDQGD